MRSVLFAGSDDVSLPTLTQLAARGWIGAVLSLPPRQTGRGRSLVATPVARYAEQQGLPLLCYERLDRAAHERIAASGCTVLVSASYGRYFPPSLLALFSDGTLNLHPSLLPRFRGPSPLVATLLSGDHYGGVSIITIAERLDAGHILAQQRLRITPATTKESLQRWCAVTGARLVVRLLASALPTGTPQDPAAVVHCLKITKAHGAIDWSQPADMIVRQIVALQRWPGSFTTLRQRRLIIHSGSVYNMDTVGDVQRWGTVTAFDSARGICVQTGKGVVAIDQLQVEYKPCSHWRQLVNGRQVAIGELLGRG